MAARGSVSAFPCHAKKRTGEQVHGNVYHRKVREHGSVWEETARLAWTRRHGRRALAERASEASWRRWGGDGVGGRDHRDAQASLARQAAIFCEVVVKCAPG